MNPFRMAADPDAAELKRVRLHEEAETKRKLIAEREATKRKRIEVRGDLPASYVIMGVVSFTAIITGGIVGYRYIEVRHPLPCEESADVRTKDDSRYECHGSARLVNTPHGSEVLMKCECRPP